MQPVLFMSFTVFVHNFRDFYLLLMKIALPLHRKPHRKATIAKNTNTHITHGKKHKSHHN